ncbi:polysaccharide biosynthesis protein GumE [Methylobacterium sp. CCH5-D2]|uniref:polysaccharide biosynthesis protein GumE n=1 Tax=Methylobacterium sp. CCH5-D2 TaxID=1768765 RepID=UPI000A83588A|nr:polysaccharide biosynthesis protein GumE [Methylobacterium sp. CCH5-D2]
MSSASPIPAGLAGPIWSAVPAGRATAAAGTRLLHLPYWLMLTALTFNAALAFVNGNVRPLTPAVVIALEGALTLGCLLVALLHHRREMNLAVAFIVWLFLFMILRSAIVDPATSVKYFRDLLIAPTFFMLGLCTDRRYLNRYVLIGHTIVFTIGALEAFRTDLYSSLFHVKDYFIATRGLTEADFWNSDSDLFVSATRPNARFLSIADAVMASHRVSSVFLEPVSLGTYCIIASAYLFALWRSLGWKSRAYLLSTNLFLIVACDGRLAFVTFFATLFVCVFWRRWSRYLPALYLPGILLAAFVFVHIVDPARGNDDFLGRVVWTTDLLESYDVSEFLGLSEAFIDKAVDSGVGYIITTQSIFGLALFWLFCSCCSRYATREQICFNHALCLYVCFNSLVSYGFLSIKTAALLWLVKGIIEIGQAPPAPGRARLPARPLLR